MCRTQVRIRPGTMYACHPLCLPLSTLSSPIKANLAQKIFEKRKQGYKLKCVSWFNSKHDLCDDYLFVGLGVAKNYVAAEVAKSREIIFAIKLPKSFHTLPYCLIWTCGFTYSRHIVDSSLILPFYKRYVIVSKLCSSTNKRGFCSNYTVKYSCWCFI